MTSKTANLNVSKNDKSSQMKQDIGKLKTLLSSGNVFFVAFKIGSTIVSLQRHFKSTILNPGIILKQQGNT